MFLFSRGVYNHQRAMAPLTKHTGAAYVNRELTTAMRTAEVLSATVAPAIAEKSAIADAAIAAEKYKADTAAAVTTIISEALDGADDELTFSALLDLITTALDAKRAELDESDDEELENPDTKTAVLAFIDGLLAMILIIKVTETKINTDLTALSGTVVKRDGSVAMTGALNMGSNPIINLKSPTALTETTSAVTVEFLEKRLNNVVKEIRRAVDENELATGLLVPVISAVDPDLIAE